MKSKEVEILKIGTVMPIVPIVGTRIYDTSQFRKVTIMIVSDGGPIFDYYISILRKECESSYSFLKTTKSIVGSPFSYRLSKAIDAPLIGELDGELIVGMSFAVGSWHSSIVEKIIDNNIVITKNSVYAIHNVSDYRDKKIDNILD